MYDSYVFVEHTFGSTLIVVFMYSTDVLLWLRSGGGGSGSGNGRGVVDGVSCASACVCVCELKLTYISFT